MITQCSIALLESALAGSLPADEEASLHRHLEECEACAAAMEQLAGGATWYQEAASLLAGDELDVSMPGHDEWSEVDFTVEHLEPADDPNVLGRLGGYDVLEIIGRGGMGIVLKGFDRDLNRCIAIKVLAPHLAHNSLAKKRFAREAQAAAAVVHPHVLAIHHVQPGGRLPFLVMPLVAGESLAKRLASQGTLELKEILRIGMQAAAGLAAAHDQGLVHRDVKPANILLEMGVERAVLTDFGLARAADDVSMTRWGIIAGTPQYMSPEQAKGEPLDGRSDLFSLGCVLYEMATGVSPFRTDSAMATMRRLVDEPPQSLAALNPELPPWFIAIVDRLLEKEPSRRFGSAKEVSELLEGCLAHLQRPTSVPLPAALSKPVPQPNSGRRKSSFKGVLTMFAAVGIVLLGAFGWLSSEPPDIAGQWTGEDWGNVVLKKTNDAEYTGTYTDTFGKKPGEIQLQWSRIECRFNGTWREGEDRFGELSVRLVNKEIHGALTTDAKSKINPGTPRLVDLTWARTGRLADKGDKASGKTTPAQMPAPMVLGPKAFRDGDLIEITDVHATSPKLEQGDSVTVRGHVRLASQDQAQLCLSVTQTQGDGGADVDNSQSLQVKRGRGDFELKATIEHRGVLHLTLYDPSGNPFGGVYFGTSPQMKQIEGWSVDYYLQGKDGLGRPWGIGKGLVDSNWAFGPEINRTLMWTASQLGRNGAARLDDGHLFNLPKNDLSHQEQEKWLNESRVNFAIDYLKETDQWEMKLRNVKFAELPDKSWESLSAKELQERFAKLEWKKATNAETQQKEKGFYSLKFLEGLNPPMMFAFETSDGHRGVLQFRAANRRATGLGNASIRYKQLQQSNTPTNVKGDGDGDKTTPNSLPRQMFRLHTKNRVAALAYSADGKLIAIANDSPSFVLQSNGKSRVVDDWKPSAEILDAETGKTVVSLKLTTDDEDAVLAATEGLTHFEVGPLEFSPDGNVVAVGTGIGQVKLFNARKGDLVRSLDDEKEKLAEKKTPEKLKSLKRTMGSVASLAFSPDGSLLAMCGGSFDDVARNWGGRERLGELSTAPGRLKLWEVKTGTLKYDLVGHSHANAVSFSPDGNLLASAGSWLSDRQAGTGVIIWNPHTGKKLRTFTTDANGGTPAVAFSPNSKLVVIGSRSFDKDNDTSMTAVSLAHALTGIVEWVQSVPGWANPKAFSPDGKSVAVLCGGQSIWFFETETGKVKHEIRAADSPQDGVWNDFAITPHGHKLAIGGIHAKNGGFVEVWNLDGVSGEGK